MTIKNLNDLSRDEPDGPEENAEYFRNYRVISAMNGHLVAGPSEIADEIIDLLRSDCEISREARDGIAEALVRGRAGNRPRVDHPDDYSPYLAVGGTGNRGKLSKAVLTRRKWFDAAEELANARLNGAKGAAPAIMIASKYGIDYGSINNATRFRNKFLKEYSDPNSDLHKLIANKGIRKEDIHEIEEYDHWQYVCRTFYIEREASAVVGVTFEQFGG
jgi:hypothetical protein